jgi:protein-disulfide isomerase
MSRTLLNIIDAKEDVRIIWKELPILGEDSVFAARAALAAGMQGKYLDFHRTLMITRSRLSEDWVMTLAEGIGLDIEKLKQDMNSTKVTQQIGANSDLARQLDIRGTPAFIIDGKIFAGALEPDKLKQIIKDARKP